MRFDRVITNPPFSQNYSSEGMQFTERFRYGFMPGERQEGRPDVRAAHARLAADGGDGCRSCRTACCSEVARRKPAAAVHQGRHARSGHRPAERICSTARASRPASWSSTSPGPATASTCSSSTPTGNTGRAGTRTRCGPKTSRRSQVYRTRHDRRQILPPRSGRRTGEERLQPQHSPLRR